MLELHQLHAYQRRMITWLTEHQRSALFAGMGLGKTVATLTAIRELLEGLAVSRVLIVAPLRVAFNTWPDELRAWAHLQDLTYKVIRGNPSAREALLSRDASQIHIINVDLFTWLVTYWGRKWPYDMVVLDESTLFKNPRSKRFRALRSIARRTGHYVALSGTPAPNGLIDLWSQVWPIDYGQEMLGRTLTAYRERWFTSDYMGYEWTPKPDAQEQIQAALSAHCLSLEAADLFDLPALVDTQILVDLPPKALTQYKKMERDFLLELDGVEIAAASAAAKSGKCLQAASGFLYDETGAWHALHEEKLKALDDVIEEAAGAPVLVAYQYRADQERLRARYPQARVLDKAPDTLKDWNAGRIPVLLAHPASCGHGISLQHGGNILAFYGLGWSLEQYQQIIERIGPMRQRQSGYDRSVFVHHILARGTLDERVLMVLQGKASTQAVLMDALKELKQEND